MTRLLYSFFMWLAQPLLRRKLRHRGARELGYLQAVEERFGHYTGTPWPQGGNTLWVHAVSLGETRAAVALVARLRECLPGMRLVLTHGTATGRAEGALLVRGDDCQAWLPWDTPAAVQRFLAHFKPRIGILMETEIWPNLVAGCVQVGVPLVLANARLSDKSQRHAGRLAWLAGPAFSGMSAVWAQTRSDAQRLTQVGAPVQGVFGNLKFDATPNPQQLSQGCAWRARAGQVVVLLASSREGEEAALLQILESFRASSPADHSQAATNLVATGVQWLIVPRHPQRFDEVAALIEAHGFTVLRRSAWRDGPPAQIAAPDAGTVWLGDSLGEMALYYGLADLALLGGSFEPLGGQNLIEAAACACPLVMGPYTFNFAEAAELAEAAGAAQRAVSLRHALDMAQALALDRTSRVAMAGAAAAFSIAHRGAVEKTAQAVVALLGQQGVDAH